MNSTLLSYCIPVMNRLDDLKATLEVNLGVLTQFAGHVEVIISSFDEDDACENWVFANFAGPIENGRLKFIRQDPLPFWHFCWAKNSFSPYISGRYYSSLDGDNFLSIREVQNTISLLQNDHLEYVVHHWSGSWGDGTSGRVTVPKWVYDDIGYLSNIFPRQFDETGLILRAIEKYPWLILVSRPGVDMIASSNYTKKFFQQNGLAVNRIEVDLGAVESPANPRGRDYVREDERLHLYQKINAYFTLYKSSRRSQAKEHFERNLKDELSRLCRSSLCSDVIPVTFSGPAIERLSNSAELTLYSVVHNDFHLLKHWVEHYRSLGVKRFIIVDDNSNPPLSEYMTDEDVFVVRPLVGDFKTFKVIWLRMLMKEFQLSGSWVLTADSDEFVDIPTHLFAGGNDETPLSGLCRSLEVKRRSYAPGILIDLLPPGSSREFANDFVNEMRFHLWRPISDSCGYGNIKPIQWAFSGYWPASFRVDARYRLFGTIDCLRKIPVFKYDESIELNQGYHTLHTSSQKLTAEEVWSDSDLVLPVRHYKMAGLLLEGMGHSRERKRRVSSYFGRTAKNLDRIYDADIYDVLRTWDLTPFKRAYEKDTRFLQF